MVEVYPEGKLLWLTVCDVRGVEPERAQLEWSQWEEGFLTRGEWQRVAERFLVAGAGVAPADGVPQ